MSETALQKAVLEIAKKAGWRVFHVRQGRAHWNLGSGYPDLTMVRYPGGRLVFAELKRETEQPDDRQSAWLMELRNAVNGETEVYVWRPSDLRTGLIKSLLS